MISEIYLFWFSAVLVIGLLLILLLKIKLHYKYLVGLNKIPKWEDLVLDPFSNLEKVFLLTMPFFISYGVDLKLENLIKKTLKIFWHSIVFYFLLLFLLLIFV